MPQSRQRSGGRLLISLVGLVISAVLLAWSLRGVELSEVASHVRDAHALPLIAAVIVATLTFPLRIPRWRLLLRAEDGSALGTGPLWHAIAIGFLANNVLPLRAGEVVRSYTISKLDRTRFTAAFSSVAVERVFDGLTVILLLVVGLFTAGLSPDVEVAGTPVTRLALLAGVVCLAALALAGLVVAFPLAAERLIRRVVPAPALADRLVAIIEGFRHGLAVLRSPSRLLLVGFWSVVLWTVNAGAFWLAFRAFDLPVGYSGALLLQGLLVLGITVPSSPGFVGVFESVIVAVLAMFEVTRSVAFTYAVTYHVTTFIPISLLGVWSLARTPVRLKDLQQAPSA